MHLSRFNELDRFFSRCIDPLSEAEDQLISMKTSIAPDEMHVG